MFDAPVQAGTTPSAPSVEFLAFFLSLPLWLALARVYGLYDSDETRTDHSSVDDLFGLFNMLTVGTWVFFTVDLAHRARAPDRPQAAAVLGLGDRVRRARARDRAQRLPHTWTPTSRTPSSSAPGTSARAWRTSCCSIPSTASTSSASSTSTRASAATTSTTSPCSAR